MNLKNFNLNQLLVAAIKSEIESKTLYKNMKEKTDNGLLKDKLDFLAKEEEKHKQYIEDIFKNHFPDKKLEIPEKSPVPLPGITIKEDTPLSKLLTQAMDAEKQASEFYKHLATRFEKGSKMNNTLMYFADMEISHYKLLENEKHSMERYEEEDVYWPMIHAGP